MRRVISAAPAVTITCSACVVVRSRRSSALRSDVAIAPASMPCNEKISAAGAMPGKPTKLTTAGGGYGFACKDPDGRNLAFVTDCADHADAADQPDRPRKIVHVNFNTVDFDGTPEIFHPSAWLSRRRRQCAAVVPALRNPDHCSIVLCKLNLPTLNHIAFEMPEFDSVMRGMGRMKANGYPIEWGPGRHGPGNNVFAYSAAPTRCRWNMPPKCCRSTIATSRGLRLLEIQARPLRPMGHHAAALAALLPGATAVRLYGRWGSDQLAIQGDGLRRDQKSGGATSREARQFFSQTPEGRAVNTRARIRLAGEETFVSPVRTDWGRLL